MMRCRGSSFRDDVSLQRLLSYAAHAEHGTIQLREQ